MTRRVILATCLLGVIGGTAGAALADGPVRGHGHQLCVVLSRHDQPTQDFCVDWGSATSQH
jgi:hypothetical protein